MKLPVLVVCLNPTLQKTLVFEDVRPGQVNRAGEVRLDASGKGVNLARVLGQLGVRARQLTQLGGVFEMVFRELCAADGVTLVPAGAAEDIRFCTTVLDKNGATELVEPGSPVGPEVEMAVRALFAEELRHCGPVAICGSKAPGFSADLFPWMVKTAKDADRPIFLDIRGDDLLRSLPFHPDSVKINAEEVLQSFGEDSPELFARLRAEFRTRLVVTDGAGPVRFWTDGGFQQANVPAVRAKNPIGSGDAFLAGMVAAFLRGPGEDLDEALVGMVGAGIRAGAENARRLKPGTIR